jgi:ribonucleoside-triphosphate reductase
LPMIRPRTKQPKVHTITDDIEGWAKSLDVLLSSFFIGGGKHPEYEGRKVLFEFHLIRKKGAIISGGFKAPGPEPLRQCLSYVEELLTQNAEEGIMKPIVAYDILCHAADAVLSWGVRRAATAAQFSIDDEEMMSAKTGDWFSKNPQRARSNNSAMILRNSITKDQFKKMFEHTIQFGEPGIVFTDSLEYVFNPCYEVGFYPVLKSPIVHGNEGLNHEETGAQACNLVEGNGSKFTTEEEFYEFCEAGAALATLQAAYTDFKFVSETSKKIIEREALIGVSITGWTNNPDVLFNEKVLRKGAQIVKATNEEVAKIIGINPAARTTCVKPSGNASVLLGADKLDGAHSKHFIRNMQVSKIQEIAKIIKDHNPYMVEDSVWSQSESDYVLSFPVIPTKKSLLRTDLPALEMLEKVKMIQNSWVEEGTNEKYSVDPKVRNNVSNTVTVKPEEWGDVVDFVFKNRKHFAGISFLAGSGDKDYYQAPYVEVMPPKELVHKYGEAAIFASGLIVDAFTGFPNLWEACRVAKLSDDQDDSSQENKDIRADWVRRFWKFANNYFDGDVKETEYCLKDTYMLHKWFKIQHNFVDMDFAKLLKDAKETDIDSMGAQACFAGSCEV